MAHLEIGDAEVVVRLNPLEMLGAFHRDVHIPRAAIKTASTASRPFSARRGLRAGGTGFPGVISLGTYRSWSRTKDFLALYARRPAVVLDLDRNRSGFDRVAVSVDDADGLVSALSPRVAR